MNASVTNVVMAGLGGQGVIKAAGIIADTAYRAGLDVKQSELHGMSQRGGSVSSDIRFGSAVLSPMVPAGGADYLVVAAPDQVEVNRPQLRQGGVLIAPSDVDEKQLPNKKSLNIALLGVLSRQLPIAESHWREAISAAFPEKLRAANDQAFTLGAADEAGNDFRRAVADADLIVLATPIGAMQALAEQIAPLVSPGCVVTDVGSVKYPIVTALSALFPKFVGSHPMAGSEHTSVEFAREGLLEEAPCIVTRTANTNTVALKKIINFWKASTTSPPRPQNGSTIRRCAA